MTEDEAKTVAAVAVQCVTWGGRLFTPGTDVGGGGPKRPQAPRGT